MAIDPLRSDWGCSLLLPKLILTFIYGDIRSGVSYVDLSFKIGSWFGVDLINAEWGNPPKFKYWGSFLLAKYSSNLNDFLSDIYIDVLFPLTAVRSEFYTNGERSWALPFLTEDYCLSMIYPRACIELGSTKTLLYLLSRKPGILLAKHLLLEEDPPLMLEFWIATDLLRIDCLDGIWFNDLLCIIFNPS